ncbi:MAG: hypothetical protein NZL91_09835 [Thermoflexales bacterium]|nr:hypothetical protein [Thermoflexales bacterium]MCS7324181.1 hypothetical protein [Thermoflexales bacterium]MCX7938407.1 hypothetical protein [Thermoflexales bacterium]MDW8053258.1 hypothetical protein [Anaerolineae bacterium]MDW8291909.1 hypothetical protein [Anaerolineae bacterium]
MKAVFEGLVRDEQDNPVEVAYVGSTPTYVVNEDGFKFHVDAHKVDRQVLGFLREQALRNEEAIAEVAMRLIGQDDLFTKAAIANAVRHMDRQFQHLLEQGLPEIVRQSLGMLGFYVVINRHGEVVRVNLPASPAPDEDEA